MHDKTEQRLEVSQEGIANCLTSVQKDSMVLQKKDGYMKDGVFFFNRDAIGSITENDMCSENEQPVSGYRIRKLTPLECFRLQGTTDEDAKKMLSVNSNSQCYKQAGNSICVDVLCAMFRNLNIKGVKTWNEYLNEIGEQNGRGNNQKL